MRHCLCFHWPKCKRKRETERWKDRAVRLQPFLQHQYQNPFNSFIYGSSKTQLLKCLQHLRDLSTSLQSSSHWQPTRHRIDFKVVLTVYKSLNGLGPKHTADLPEVHEPNKPLRSLGTGQLAEPRIRTKKGEFSLYAATCRNKLPDDVRYAPDIVIFKSRLKTYLFSWAFVQHCTLF